MTQATLTEAPAAERRFLSLRLAIPEGQEEDQFDATISTTEPVDRSWGIEVLVHTAQAVDLGRASQGLPLLLDHDPTKQVGRVHGLRIENERLRGRLRFGNGQVARDVLADVRAGIRQELSVGYEILDTRPGTGRQVQVTRWRPLEVSIVAIPADPRSGIGRSRRLIPMSETDTVPADAGPMGRADAPARMTREHQDILALGELGGEPEMARDAVIRGLPLEEFRRQLIERRAGKQKPLGVHEPEAYAASSKIYRGFRASARSAIEAPKSFSGTMMRAADGSFFPALAPADRLASFIQNDDWAQEARELGVAGFIRALTFGPKTSFEKRVLGGASVGTGGAMLPTPISAELIDRLRAQSVAILSGARTIPMDTQTLRFARVTSDPAGAWRAENASITESDPVFDNLTLSAKSWGVMTRVSRELLADAPNTEMVISNLMARVAALALDRAILVGSGSGNEPLGIRGTSGIQTVSMGTNGAQLTNWVQPLNAIQLLEDANAGAVSAMIAAPRTTRALNGWVATDNQPLLAPPRVQGIPVRGTTAMPVNETQGSAVNASTIILGDFTEVFVGLRTEIEITVHPDRYADQGQIAVIAFMRADVQLARPAAMARIIGIIP